MAASVWRELSALPEGEKLLDRYGLVASRWASAQRAERPLPPTWLLDKKGFRRALTRELPPGHGVGDIAADPKPERRASRAARAHDRTLGAARDLELPELPASSVRVLVWASPVIRPRGVELPFLAQSLEVEPSAERVRGAIGELWASVFFDECLRQVRARSLRRVEIATGLSALLPRASAEQEDLMQLLLLEEPVRAVVPLPGRAGSRRVESPLELSLGKVELTAFRAALSLRFGRLPEELSSEGPGRFELGVDALAELAESRPSQEHLALAELTGFESRAAALGRAGGKPSRLSLGRTVGEEILRQSALSVRVQQHESAVAAAVAALSELDLAVLPDDGLKRTLEDAERLFRENAEVRSEALVSAELLVASAEALEPESALSVDAGLEGLGWLRLLAAWEERLSIVRNDGACTDALLARADLPEGPGLRALRDAERTLAHLGPSPLGPQEEPERGMAPNEWLLTLARLAVESPADVTRASREARFAADRRLAAIEAKRGHWFALSLSAVRSLARDAVLLRETTRLLELSLNGLLGRIGHDVDRRLRRIEPALPSGAAFDCTLEELVEAVDLRGSSLAARVAWRRAERRRQRARKLDWWAPQTPAREGRTGPAGKGPVVGETLSLGEGRGLLQRLEEARLRSGAAPVLACEGFSPMLVLALPYVSGLLTSRGCAADSVATAARALGVPVLVAEPPLAATALRVILRASLLGGNFDVAEAMDGAGSGATSDATGRAGTAAGAERR